MKLFILPSLAKNRITRNIYSLLQGMLVEKDFASKLAMNNPESCSITSLANSKLFLMVNLLVVIGSKIGTKCLAIS